MGIFAPLKKSFEKLQKDLEIIGKEAVENNEKEIVQYFQDNQIGMGLKVGSKKDLVYIRRKGSNRIGYSKLTQPLWEESWDYQPDYDKSEGNPYYMEWSGDFFRSMGVLYMKGFKYTITSNDGKLQQLFHSYGSDILQIGDTTNKEIQKRILIPEIDKEVIKRIEASLV